MIVAQHPHCKFKCGPCSNKVSYPYFTTSKKRTLQNSFRNFQLSWNHSNVTGVSFWRNQLDFVNILETRQLYIRLVKQHRRELSLILCQIHFFLKIAEITDFYNGEPQLVIASLHGESNSSLELHLFFPGKLGLKSLFEKEEQTTTTLLLEKAPKWANSQIVGANFSFPFNFFLKKRHLVAIFLKICWISVVMHRICKLLKMVCRNW